MTKDGSIDDGLPLVKIEGHEPIMENDKGRINKYFSVGLICLVVLTIGIIGSVVFFS